ncbi:hypothetical protein AMECASPLE_015076, partial [Ameca splendens]
MEIGLRLAVSFFELIIVLVLGGTLDDLKQKINFTEALTVTGVRVESSSMQCAMQGTPLLPAFSMDGDFVIGGAFFIHYKMQTVINNYTTKPEVPTCTGRL